MKTATSIVRMAVIAVVSLLVPVSAQAYGHEATSCVILDSVLDSAGYLRGYAYYNRCGQPVYYSACYSPPGQGSCRLSTSSSLLQPGFRGPVYPPSGGTTKRFACYGVRPDRGASGNLRCPG